MKTVAFTQSVTVYPDGKTPERYEAGQSHAFADDYADLLVHKGHGVIAGEAPAPAADPAAQVAADAAHLAAEAEALNHGAAA